MSLKMMVLRCVEISGFFCPLPHRHNPEVRKPRPERCTNFPPFQDNVMRTSSREEMSLKMMVLRCVEISGFFCPLPQRHNPEERKPRLERSINVKTRTCSVLSNLL
jgi:hypothetical protein